MTKNKLEFIQANLAISLALGLNGILTNVLKLCVGEHNFDIYHSQIEFELRHGRI